MKGVCSNASQAQSTFGIAENVKIGTTIISTILSGTKSLGAPFAFPRGKGASEIPLTIHV